MNINPYDTMNDWKQCCTTQLADAQRYYEKWQIDKMIDDLVISGGGVTSGIVQEMIDEYDENQEIKEKLENEIY